MNASARSILALAALLVVAVAAGCSDDGDGGNERAAAEGPCALLSAEDAAGLLGGEVESIGFVELFESENGPVEDDVLEAVEAAGEKICAFELVGERDGAVAALQLDVGLFDSEAQFAEAWSDETEIIDSPGLATAFEARGGFHRGAANVLLNAAGDSLALTVYRTDSVSREALLDLAAELTSRY